VLNTNSRKKLVSTTRDIHRNFSIARWMINKHLDFVSTFTFQPNTGNEALDDRLSELMAWWSKPENYDAAKRHGLRRSTRLFEARRTLDGDVFALKLTGLRNRGKIQAVEGDRVRDVELPRGSAVSRQDLTHGVNVNQFGAATGYTVAKRTGNYSFEFERYIPSAKMIHHAYYDRFDQVRGISPLACAINQLRDVYENFDYALAKMKVSQLFGLTFYRDAVESFEDTTATTDSEGNSTGYDVDFGKGPVVLDLEPGDKAEFLESKTPTSEFQNFTQTMIGVTLKALDLPYSFYDESFTTFFGSRAALIQYQQAAQCKRDDNRDFLRQQTDWRLGLFVDDGVLELPAGMKFQDIKYEWVAGGLPWWDQAKEIAGDEKAIALKLRTRSEIRRERYGDDWKKNVIDKIKEEETYAAAKGVELPQPMPAGANAAAEGATDDAE
jgi:capsid protein